MRGLTFRDQVLGELEAGRERVREAIAGLSPSQMTEPTLGGWSVRDHLNHLATMHEFRFFEISRVARGGRAVFANQSDTEMDALNALFASWRKDVSPEQAVADLEFAWALVIDTVASVGEDCLIPSKYLEVGPQGGAAHDREHAAAILAWRKSRGY